MRNCDVHCFIIGIILIPHKVLEYVPRGNVNVRNSLLRTTEMRFK